MQEALRLCRDIAETGFLTVALTGGEPMLRKDVFEIMRELKDYDLEVVLVTDGTLISDECIVHELAKYISVIQISLDGDIEAIHDSFRGVSNAFKKAVRAIELCVAHGIPVYINHTLTRFNISRLERFLEFAAKLGVRGVNIILPHPVGRAQKTYEYFAPGFEEVQNVLTKLVHLSKLEHSGLEVRLSPLELVPLTQKESLLLGGCSAARTRCNIAPNGDVQPCPMLRISAGNVRRQRLVDIWLHAELFEKLRDRDALRGACGHCELKYVCGGCRARAYYLLGDLLGEDPLCPLKLIGSR